MSFDAPKNRALCASPTHVFPQFYHYRMIGDRFACYLMVEKEEDSRGRNVPVARTAFSLFVFTIGAYLLYSYMPIFGKRSTSYPAENLSNETDRGRVGCGPSDTFNTSLRTTFYGSGCSVYGWPSSGGMLKKQVDGAELKFLGLDRFQSALKSSDQTQEDEFCQKLRNIGAKWWKSRNSLIECELGVEREFKDTEKFDVELETGWPAAGGVWVIKAFSRRVDINARPKEMGKIHMAFNMEERSRVIEELGGKFYQDPKDCPDLAIWSRKPAKEEMRDI